MFLEGLEYDLSVSMMKKMQDKNINVEAIVIDNDTTTKPRVRN